MTRDVSKFFFQNSSLSRAFKLFRALGLRHIVVVDENNEVSRPGDQLRIGVTYKHNSAVSKCVKIQ